MWSSALDLVIGRNAPALLHPPDISNEIALKSYAPGDNLTSLTDDIRAALSNTTSSLRTWDDETASVDAEYKEHLRALADQIDSKAHEITSSAWRLLEELDQYSSTPPSVVELGELSPVDYTFEHFNLTVGDRGVGDGGNWLKGMRHEVSIIESWEEEAEKLSLIAIAAFENLKSGTTNIKESASREAMSVMHANANEMYRKTQLDQVEKERLQRERQKKYENAVDAILSFDETWKSGGFEVEEVIPPDIALGIIRSFPLKTYKLRDDKNRDLGVSKDERRTRYHVGVINQGDGDTRLEPSTIFSYNIGAVSQLAMSLERILSNLTVSASFFTHQSSLREKATMLMTLTESQVQGGNSFRSPSQLASEVAALETEAALTRISRLSQEVTVSTGINLIYSRLLTQLKSHTIKSESLERVSVIEGDSISARENHVENAGSYLDQLIIHFDVIDNMKSVWTQTKREFAEINEAAKIESHIAREEIHAEAVVERENESASLNQIKLVGKARMEEVIHVIETFFWHLAGSLQHVLTPVGRQQFLFYVGSIAVLVFAVSTIQEMITLMCIRMLRFLTAPRLVREYGNLNTRVKRFPERTQVKKEIVLPADITERMETIVRVASAASMRRFPLRSVLIHGKPGSGKSMAAKELAQSIPNIPYAMMSGADVYPMGSQGPAELRRLLTWASTRRQGGIIIIDEAESALGCRAKAKADKAGADNSLENNRTAGYSRDCLNVLLSMTGSFGIIMLVLTSSNPNDLDEAVLDRMDEIIHLPLPSSDERCRLLRNQFFLKFRRQDESEPSLFLSLLPKFGRSATKARYANNFDVENCIIDLAAKTHGLSGRELEKMMQGVLYKTFASDTGVLDILLWRRETEALIRAVAERHLLKA